MKVCVIGLGDICLPTAAMFANAGHDVLGVDKKPQIVEALNRGEIIIEENGLPEYIKAVVEKGHLRAVLELYNLPPVRFPYVCSLAASRRALPELASHSLNNVAAYFDIRFRHHNALEDALTCAKILHEVIGTDQTIRASLYFYNTKEEVDRFIEAASEISLENAVSIFF